MKRILLLILVAACTGATAQNSKIQEYINQYSDLAIAEMMRTGVPACITLAQGIVETDAGQGSLVKNTNNHFGIKCKTEWTGNTYLYDDDAKNECFRSYGCAADSYKDHSDFLKNRPNYAFLFKLDQTDYEGWARGLRKAGYATNPKYAQMLINTIVTNNLQQYSLLAIQRMNKKEDVFAATITPKESTTTSLPLFTDTGDPENQTAAIENNIPEEPLHKKEETVVKVAQTILVAPSYPTGEFSINTVRVLYVPAGTSLFALSSNNNISFKKLLEFNDLDEIDILEKEQLIFLEKKPKKGEKNIHIAEASETMYDIAQKEGVNLKSLLEYNRLNKKDARPLMGEKIYLRTAGDGAPKLVQ